MAPVQEKKNFALVLHPKIGLKLEERPFPTPSPEDVVLEMHSTGICGTDIHMWSHGSAGKVTLKEPFIIGHESSGVVVQIGSNVKTLKVGDRVCVEPAIPCFHCEHCLYGRYNLCLNLDGRGYPNDGMCCNYYAHPAQFAYKMPDNVSFEEGALVEPLAVVIHGCRRADVKFGNTILICGAGAIGLLSLICVKAMGASKVCVTDIRQSRLDKALELGADHVLLVTSDVKNPAEEIIKKMGGPVDVTLDCCGMESTIKTAVSATMSGGVVTIIGLGTNLASIDMTEIVMREIDLRGCSRYKHCYPVVLNLLSTGVIKVSSVVTHRYLMEEATKAFEVAASGADGCCKVIIKNK